MKKLLLTITILTTFLSTNSVAFAHDVETTEKSGEKSGDSSQQQTVTVTAEDFDFTTDSDNSTVTLLYADGTPLANASVTVKNAQSGQDGDIEMNQVADANGLFDYSKWIDAGVAVLRVTDPVSNASIEYIIENGNMTIEAGKNKNNSGTSTSGPSETTASNTYLIIGVVGAVIVVGAIVVVMAQKKKKAAFEASKKAKKSKKD